MPRLPDYRRLLPVADGRRALVEVAAFRTALETGPVRSGEPGGHDLSVLSVADGGSVVLCADGDGGPNRVAVNRAFLLDALSAGARDRLTWSSVRPRRRSRSVGPTTKAPSRS